VAWRRRIAYVDGMKLLYFAWVRERIGKTDEEIAPPPHVATVGDLIGWLSTRGENYAHAFENAATIRAALDHRHVKHDAVFGGAREVAFFPPMTGG
jgi:molybdopterin synthase sulfur carrier subunit